MEMVGCVNHHYDPTPSETSETLSLLEVISFIGCDLNPYGERIGRVETIITHLNNHVERPCARHGLQTNWKHCSMIVW